MDARPVTVFDPAHYQDRPPGIALECITYRRHLIGGQSDAAKYLYRAGRKGGPERLREDLGKARWYLTDALAHAAEHPPARAPEELLRTVDPLASRRARLFAKLLRGELTLTLARIESLLADPNLTIADLEWSADQ